MSAVVEVSLEAIPEARAAGRAQSARAAWCREAMDAAAASGSGAVEVVAGLDGAPFGSTVEAARHAGYLRNMYGTPEYRGLRVKQRRNRSFIVKEEK